MNAFVAALPGAGQPLSPLLAQPALLPVAGLGILLLLLLFGLTKPRWLATLLTHVLNACEQGIAWCASVATATLQWGHHWAREQEQPQMHETMPPVGYDEPQGSLAVSSPSAPSPSSAASWTDSRTVWTGFIVIARTIYVALAVYLMLAAYSMDFGRACLVQLEGDCAVHLPIDTGTANAGLWFLGIAFFGSLLSEALGWYPPQLHLVPAAKRSSQVALGVYAALGTLIGMSGAVLLAVIAALELQHLKWPSGVIVTTLLQAVLVNGALVGCAVALVFGIGGLVALVLYTLEGAFELLRFLVGLLLRLVQREPEVAGEQRVLLPSVDRQAARATWLWTVGRGIARLAHGVQPLVRRYGAEHGVAGYGSLDPKRLYDAPVKAESQRDFSPTRAQVQLARERTGASGNDRVVQRVIAECAGELARRIHWVGQPDGDILLLIDAEALDQVVPVLALMHRQLPDHRIAPVVRLPARGTGDARVAVGLAHLQELQEQHVVLPPLPLDPRAPFVLSAQHAGEECLDRLLTGAFAGLIAAPIQDRAQPTFGELGERIGRQWPSTGIATMSASVPKGRPQGLVRSRGYGDLPATIFQSLQLSEQLLTDPDLRTTQTPQAACGQPVALLFIAPIPLRDAQRWHLYRDAIGQELASIAPSAEPLFVSGGGVPAASATPDPYHVQVVSLFGMPVEGWADEYRRETDATALPRAGTWPLAAGTLSASSSELRPNQPRQPRQPGQPIRPGSVTVRRHVSYGSGLQPNASPARGTRQAGQNGNQAPGMNEHNDDVHAAGERRV